VSLVPIRYEFERATPGDTWASNWLVINGEIDSPNGSWSFQDSCVTTFEARGLTQWMQGAAHGTLQVTQPRADGEVDPGLTFVEPSLAFSLARIQGEARALRVHLSHLAAPPWLSFDDRLNTWHHFVEVRMLSTSLLKAAEEWATTLRGFPDREPAP
jgi:hypothetical protein